MRFRNLSLLLILFSLFGIQSLRAQTPGTGALTGTVKDPSGAVIPSAMVTLTSINTGQARTATTGADGVYHFNLLPPGNYRVRMEASGFKPVDVPSVTVAVTETEVLDRNLDVGAQAQTVTVEGEVENIQTASSALGTVVNTRSMEALPLSTRNYTNLLAMTAGANAGVANSTTLGKSATGIAVNGADIGQNTYLQDGVAVNTWSSTNTTQEGTNSGAFPTPNPDTIQEFKIQVSNYDSGYGRNPGANVNVITKSGTNNFHGSAFEFFRNTALNANDYFFNASNAPGTPKPVLNENQFGGTFGGPVKKDKLFFFVAYQETTERNGIAGFGYSVLNLPPIPNMPRGNCPLSAISEAGCDPTAQTFAGAVGAAVCGNGTGTKGSISVACDGSNINPVALRLMQLTQANGQYVMPGAYTVPGGCTVKQSLCPAGTSQTPLASFTDPAKFNDHQGMGNFDYILNSKHSLSGRYFFEQDPINGNFASNGTRITASNVLPGFPVFEQKTYHAALLRLTSVLSNNMVNEARASYQRVIAVASTVTNDTNSQIGINPLTPGVDNLSEVTIKGLGGLSFGSNTAFGLNNTSNQFEGADQVSWTHGIHTFRFGAEGQHVINDASSAGSGYMNITFKTFQDFLLGLPTCAAGATGPVVTIPNTSSVGGVPCNGGSASNIQTVGGTTQAFAGYRYMFRLNYIDAFAQDDIKLTPRFTLNAGVRWERDGFPTVANGVTGNFWPTLYNAAPVPGSGCTINGVQVGTGSSGCSLAGFVVPNNYQGNLPAGVTRNSTDYVSQTAPSWHNFAPRLGFAWQPTSSNRFVVRGGAGMFYELINGVQAAYMPMRVMPGAVNVQQSPASSWQTPGILPAAYPGPFGGLGFTPLWGDPKTAATSNLQLNVSSQDMKTPVTYEWNLNTQYEFLPNWVLELGYVGSHGIHQEQGGSVINATNWNMAQLITPTSTINGITCDNVATFCNTSSNANLRAPYLGFSTNSNQFGTTGAYRFDALLTTVRKQFSKGLQLQVSYTWSKGLLTQGYGIDVAPYKILQMGPNADYHPQRVVINYVWNLPVHMNGIAGKVLNDWTWAGVTTIQDGVPFSVIDGNSGSAIFQGGVAGDTYGPAEICPGVNPLTSGPIETRLGGPLSANGYLNTAAFSDGKGAACSLPPLGGAPGQPAKTVGTGFGNLGLGTYLSPGQYNWDMSIAKLIKIRESKSLEFRGEFFNTFNHPQFSFNPVDDPAFAAQDSSASNFGQITVSSVNPRLIQFVLKFLF
jgi:carboxypeptidase family protein/TonB-dependent receptor-like protein